MSVTLLQQSIIAILRVWTNIVNEDHVIPLYKKEINKIH